jgi:hypothetical protein
MAASAQRFSLSDTTVARHSVTNVKSTALLVGGSSVVLAGCATTYGPALSNVGAEPSYDVYLYGTHADAVTALPVTSDSNLDSAKLVAATKDAPEPEKATRKTVAEDPAQHVANKAESGTSIAPGTFRGTDWVTIDLPGFPADEQVDDKARVVLAKLDGESRYSFTVLDTNSGSELCSVEGAAANELIVFEPGQSCFGGILGIPMESALYEGEGRINEGSLEVTLGIELTVLSPDGDDLTGDLSYRFEGKLHEGSD